MRESRLQQPGHREQRMGQRILQQRVCGHTLQVCHGLHAPSFLPREDANVSYFVRVFQRRVRGVVLHQEPDDGNGQIKKLQFPEQNGRRRTGIVQ